VLAKAEEIIFNVCSRNGSGNSPRPIRDGIDQFHDKIEYLHSMDNKLIGIPTGLTDLDKLLGGLQKTDVILLAGRPGSGKTSLALSIGLYAAKQFKRRVAVFSLEMSEEQLIQRLVASESGIDSQRLRLGSLKDDEWPFYLQATAALADCPIFIDDTPAISAMDLRSKARRLDSEYGLDLLIVDYLQLMSGDRKSENRQQEVSFISRSVKALARELKIPVLALSQLSRQCESRGDKRPILSDLRESGSLEQDSDVVIFLYQDGMYNPDTDFPNIVELIVSKHRSGPTGVLSVYFKKHLAQFMDLEMKQQFEPVDWVK
jgi:replicative DNA helicase